MPLGVSFVFFHTTRSMRNYAFICFIFISQLVVSQNYIYDLDTKTPIEAVNIYFSDALGIITNEDGYFELPDQLTTDTLAVSHLSYTSKTIALADLKNKDTIFLSNAPIVLDEIVLRNINPKDSVLKAIENIDKNYINTPYNAYGFFRQSLQENKKGVEMIEVEFIGYNKNKSVSTKILDARRTENYSKLGLKTHGGVAAMFENGDFVRNKAHFLDPEKLDLYEFKFEGQVPYQGMTFYKIRFYPKSENIEVLRKGVLYIEAKSFAIAEIRYTYDKEKLAEISKESEKGMTTKNPIYRLKDVDNLIRYKQLTNGKWGLIYIEAYNLREGLFENQSYDYHLTAKLVINTIKTEKPVKVKTNYNLTKDFSKVVKKFDNLDRWDDNYRLSLSRSEKQLLKDIEAQQPNIKSN